MAPRDSRRGKARWSPAGLRRTLQAGLLLGGAPVLELRVGEGKERVPGAAEASGGTRGRGLVRERAESKSSFSERENAARSWEQPPALPPPLPRRGRFSASFRDAKPSRASELRRRACAPLRSEPGGGGLLPPRHEPQGGQPSPHASPRLGGPLPDVRGNNELQLATVDLWAIYTRLGGYFVRLEFYFNYSFF